MYSETKNDSDTVGDDDELIIFWGNGETIFDQIKHLLKMCLYSKAIPVDSSLSKSI